MYSSREFDFGSKSSVLVKDTIPWIWRLCPLESRMLDRSGQLMYQTEPAVVATIPIAMIVSKHIAVTTPSRKISSFSLHDVNQSHSQDG